MRVGFCSLTGCSGHEAGRNLLAAIYREETGQEMPNILTTVRGKPFFEHSPYYFSISHTSRHAFCVLSRTQVGIDAEELDRTVAFSHAGRILSPSEFRRFCVAGNPNRAFLAMWVLKEATAKYTGAGLTGCLNTTDFSPDDPRVFLHHGCIAAIVCQSENKEEITFHDF